MKILNTPSTLTVGYKLASYNEKGKICSMLTGQEYKIGPVEIAKNICPLSNFYNDTIKGESVSIKKWSYYNEDFVGYTSIYPLKELEKLISNLWCNPENIFIIKVTVTDPVDFVYGRFTPYEGAISKNIESIEFFRDLTKEEKISMME